MEIRNLETFLRVVSDGSYSKAALSLGVSQPAVSARLGALEEQLGQFLFERQGNTMVVSAAGKRLLPYAESMVQLVKDAELAVSDPSGLTRSPVVRLGANAVVSAGPLARWLTPILEDAARGGPRVDVHVDATPGLMQALFSGVVQVALVNSRLATHQATTLWTRQFPMVMVASTDHALAGESVRLADLSGELFVSHEVGPSANEIGAMSTRLGSELDVLVRTNSADVMKRLIRRGTAIGLLPGPVVEDELALGTLREIAIEDYTPEPWDMALVRWSDRWLPASVAVFAELLVHQLEASRT